MRVREVRRLLKRDGWFELPRGNTAHIHLKHPTKPGKVTVADHKGDMKERDLASIEKQSGLKLRRR